MHCARQCGVLDELLLKEHTHTFINKGGDVRELDFRFMLGAPFHGLKAFFTTPQITNLDKAQNAVALATSPVVKALFNPEGAMKDIRALDSVSVLPAFRMRSQASTFHGSFLSHASVSSGQLLRLVHLARRLSRQHHQDVGPHRLRPRLHRL